MFALLGLTIHHYFFFLNNLLSILSSLMPVESTVLIQRRIVSAAFKAAAFAYEPCNARIEQLNIGLCYHNAIQTIDH